MDRMSWREHSPVVPSFFSFFFLSFDRKMRNAEKEGEKSGRTGLERRESVCDGAILRGNTRIY